MARPWLFGNTTVRSAFRLKDGLAALVSSGYLGVVEGDNETAFAWALHNAGVVELSASTEDVSSIARKWRSALTKLGFLIPKVTLVTEVTQDEIGPKFTVTANGQRLLDAKTAPAIQEVFLRAISAIQIPSPTERNFAMATFSPYRHTLAVMLELERLARSPHITFIEMATVVQLSSTESGVHEVAVAVLDVRARRERAANKKTFDREEAGRAAATHGLKWGTYFDYADTNFRYFKATGVVQNKGRGITLVPEQHVLAQTLVAQSEPTLGPVAYFKRLFDGAVLPTDDQDGALVVLESLKVLANARGVGIDISGRSLETPADIAIVRHELEDAIFHSKEEEFAEGQFERIEEILTLLSLINERRATATLSNGDEVKLPLNEVPAYFEWALWRVFLALRHYILKPHELRRFNIDQDFLPMGTAAGGGSDVIVEFDDYVIVVEVTLTEGSRQEAAEGEPVRRHVAQAVEQYEAFGKTVYGLFIAKRIDSNTAETFRIGVWYRPDDTRMTVDVVPLTLSQFRTIVEEIFTSGVAHPDRVRATLEEMTVLRHETSGAPEWKQKIAEAISQVA